MHSSTTTEYTGIVEMGEEFSDRCGLLGCPTIVGLSSDEKVQLQSLLRRYKEVFAYPGNEGHVEHRIPLTSDVPIMCVVHDVYPLIGNRRSRKRYSLCFRETLYDRRQPRLMLHRCVQ